MVKRDEDREYGSKLRGERQRRGKTIFECGTEIGVKEGTWWKWEMGRAKPRGVMRRLLREWFTKGEVR
jgi:transcriptional regulator with XRE-family HTH domain